MTEYSSIFADELRTIDAVPPYVLKNKGIFYYEIFEQRRLTSTLLDMVIQGKTNLEAEVQTLSDALSGVNAFVPARVPDEMQRRAGELMPLVGTLHADGRTTLYVNPVGVGAGVAVIVSVIGTGAFFANEASRFTPEEMTRRDFLTRIAIMAGGLSLAGAGIGGMDSLKRVHEFTSAEENARYVMACKDAAYKGDFIR